MKTDRRKLIKALTLGGGAVTITKIPSTWSKPVVDSVVLPAHAQTTGTITTLAGALTTGGFVMDADGARYRNFAERSDHASPLARFIGDAHAGIDVEHEPRDRLYGYAERDPGRGDGWWFVQVLAHFEVPYGIGQTDGGRPESSILDHLVQPAHALVADICVVEVLWETYIQIVYQNGAFFESLWKNDVGKQDSCGDLDATPLSPGARIDCKLRKFTDPNSPASGDLLVRDGKELFELNLDLGGSRRSVNCAPMACEKGPIKNGF